MPARLWMTSITDPYRPNSPTPAGPRNSALAFMRTTPSAMLTADEPPIIAVDFRICPYECLAGASAGVRSSVVKVGAGRSAARVVMIGRVAESAVARAVAYHRE